ncbi:MAG: hypothetical protein AAF485_16490 [Chloroflexota bacterium]
MHGNLYAGVARIDITPAIGTTMLHPLRESAAVDIEQPLTATVLVLASGDTKIALVGCDNISFRGEYADQMRAWIGEKIGTPASHILINASHSHAVPSMPGREMPNKPTEAHLTRYHEWLLDVIPGAAQWANHELQPARLGAGKGAVQIGINRREQLPDGTMILGENPDGPIDEDVGVLRVDDLDGKPIALVVNYTCHPDCLGPKVPFFSPDYVGQARAAAEALTGVPMLFLQGAAGDIDPTSGIALQAKDSLEEIKRLGLQLGAEAAKVFAQIRTHRYRDQREIFASMSDGLPMWRYKDKTGPAISAMQVTTRRLIMPLHPYPSAETAQAELQAWQEKLAKLEAKGASLPERQLAERYVGWNIIRLQAIQDQHKPEIELELQVIRLNNIAFVAIPVEPFVEIGLNIKQQSPLTYTFVCGYSNGCMVYVPTAAAFEQGGYEVRSHINYMLPSGVTPAWAGIIEQAAVEMLNEMMN